MGPKDSLTWSSKNLSFVYTVKIRLKWTQLSHERRNSGDSNVTTIHLAIVSCYTSTVLTYTFNSWRSEQVSRYSSKPALLTSLYILICIVAARYVTHAWNAWRQSVKTERSSTKLNWMNMNGLKLTVIAWHMVVFTTRRSNHRSRLQSLVYSSHSMMTRQFMNCLNRRSKTSTRAPWREINLHVTKFPVHAITLW